MCRLKYYSNMIVFIVFLLTCSRISGKDTITIESFYPGNDEQVTIPFRSLIYSNNLVNKKTNINYNLTDVSVVDSYELKNIIQHLWETSENLIAIFSSSSNVENALTESICSSLGVIYIEASCFYKPSSNELIINFCPERKTFSKALATIVDNLHWRNFIIFYENEENLIMLQDVLKLQVYDEEELQNKITLRHLGDGPDYRPLLKEVKNITSVTQYIIDCKFEKIMDILDQAYEIQLMGPFKSFFLTSLDAHLLDFKKFGYDTNITTIRITNPEDRNFRSAVESWRYPEYQKDFSYSIGNNVTINLALIHDAVHHFIETIKEMKPLNMRKYHDKDSKNKIISRILRNMIEKTQEFSLTGPIEFDDNGNRINFILQLIDVIHDNKVIATWNGKTPDVLYSNRSAEEYMQTIEEDLKKTVVQVYSKLGEPYLSMRKAKPGEELTGNDRYQGFSLDFIQAIANFVGFTFEMEIADGYGKYDTNTKRWDGLIGKVIDKKAHLAICDLTINRQRLAVIDFSTHFMTLGIAVLLKKPELNEEGQLFSFMNPFGVDVWIYTVTLYLIITISIYFVTRLSNTDWISPHPCDSELEELENIWDMKNCMWLTMGSIMTQGCDILPKGISSRTAVCMWWFFCLIMPSTYTANLAAFMTHQGDDVTVDNVEELAEQTQIKYGTVYKASTYTFFSESEYPTYQKMWVNMQQFKPSVFVRDNYEGVNMVENSKGMYAFLMESTQIEYVTETKCNLKQVGNWLDTRRYGIGMPLNAPYRSIINNAILKLQENGTIEMLKKRWWKLKRDEPSCKQEEDEEAEDSDALGLKNVGGVFVVLLVGIAISYIIGIGEFLWNVKNVAKEQHISFCRAFILEWKFVINFKVNKKLLEHPELDLVSSSSNSSNDEDRKNIALAIIQGTESILAMK